MDFRTNALGSLAWGKLAQAAVVVLSAMTITILVGSYTGATKREAPEVQGSYDEVHGVACYWLQPSSNLVCIQVNNGIGVDEAEEAKELLPGPEGIKYVF